MNYGELKQRVSDRLNRPDLLLPIPPNTDPLAAPIPQFVQDRILFYQKALYAPSDQLDYSITTIPSQSIYMIPDGQHSITGIRFLLTNIWIPLVRANWYQDILEADVLQPPFITLPAYFAQKGQTIRLYPTPAFALPLEINGNNSPPAPQQDTDENYWTQEAQTLIIEATCADLLRLHINDPAAADQHEAVVTREAHAQVLYTQRLKGPAQIRMHM